MTWLNTRRFSQLGLLTFVAACSDAPAPADVPDDPTPDEVELDAGRSVDAARSVDANITRLDATAHADARVESDARPPLDDAPTEPAACVVTDRVARCTSRELVRIGAASDPRNVYWALPTSPPPAQGYPVVVLYQGSLYGPSTSWNVDIDTSTPFGGYYQVVLITELLAHGYAVIQPPAQGELYWSTNVSANFASSVDGVFIPLLLEAMADGRFGTLDLEHLYATGISSGGYMTSRMAVSFPGRFRALAIQSAAYATCGGPLCLVPSKLPADHPPTLFLHGARDATVPISTAESYQAALKSAGIETDFVRDAEAGHQWLANAPAMILRWFDTH